MKERTFHCQMGFFTEACVICVQIHTGSSDCKGKKNFLKPWVELDYNISKIMNFLLLFPKIKNAPL